VWLDGRLVAADRARVSALSQTLLRGIGLFETMRMTRGTVPLLDLHLERLRRSCRDCQMSEPSHRLEKGVSALAERVGGSEGVVRMTVGDGLELVTLGPLPRGLERERQEGIALPSIRTAWDPVSVKHTSRAGLEWAEREVGGEALRVGPAGQLLETTRSNLFVVTPDRLETAPDGSILPGIARRLVLAAARELGFRIRRRSPRLAEAESWREVFVTNAVRGVRPVVEVAGRPIPAPAAEGTLRPLQRRLDLLMGLKR
jgi:branched-subunit amino acid aminotransferase/4-amino-4-deoxychorismate lyase